MTPRALIPSALFSLVLMACPGGDDTKTDDSAGTTDSFVDTYVAPVDADGDGQTAEDGDCDDSDPDRYVGRLEECDGIDNNCNDLVDEGMPDADSDGTADCMDEESCDGVDNDGDGAIDEGFADADGDGVADCVGTERCDGIDNDGDGDVDEGYDADGDGYTQCGSSTRDPDCDDSDASVNPGAPERDGNSVDDDCDGVIDSATWAAGDLSITEVMTNPQAVSDPSGEWIEIRNNTTEDIAINGMELRSSDGDYHQIVSDSMLMVEAGGFIVVGSNANMDTNGGAPVDYEWSGISLANETDDIELWGGSVLVDSLAWDDGFTMPDPAGASIMVDPGYYGATANDNPAVWCAATMIWGTDPTADKGSPNGENELCSTWDHDGDGYSADEGDCDDNNDTVYPDAYEGNPKLDNDCDGDVEEAPFAVATLITGAEACTDFQLSGTGSYDNQGSALTYRWDLVSAPGLSSRTSADITTTTSSQPTFNPDVPGDYTFSLTVNDGGTDSLPDTIVVTVNGREYNNTPVAYAGADQTTAASADCQPISYGVSYDCDDCSGGDFSLSATSSSDPDGDRMEYAWTLEGSSSSYATMSETSGNSTTVSFSSVPSTYGVETDYTATVTLTATDCMGAVDTDEVVLTYGCTGS